MVERAGAHQVGVGIHGPRHGVRHVHHLQRMLEGARRFLLQLADHRVGDVAELDEPGIGHQVENALEQIDERIARHREHGADEQAQERRPDVARDQFGGAEAKIAQREHPEGDQRREELLPAAVEVAEGQDADHARHEEHHEEHGAVVAENQQRQQGHHVDGHHDTVLHEGLQEQGHQREGNEIERLLVDADQDQRGEGAQQEDHHQIREAGVFEDLRVVEKDGQIQQHHDRQGDQDVAQDQQEVRSGRAHVGLELALVGIEHLGDLRRHDLLLLHDQLPGGHVARRGRDAGHRLGVHQGRGLLVEEQVRHQQVVGAGGAEQRVDIGVGDVGKVGEQAHARFRQPIDFGDRILDGALVALDVEDLRAGGVPATRLVGQDALLVDRAERGNGRAAQAPQVQPLGCTEIARDDLVGILVIRNRLGGGLAPLGHHLLLGLVDREVELGIQRLVFPGAPFAVVVGELGAPRHQHHQQEECDTERDEYADERVPGHRAAI